MHFRDDHSLLRNPTDPSGGGGGGKPVTFPFHNAIGKPLSSPSGASPGEQRRLEQPCFHPLGTQTAAQRRQSFSFLPVRQQGLRAARGQGVPCSQRWLRPLSPEGCTPNIGHAPFGVQPARSQQRVGDACAPPTVRTRTPAVPGGESHRMGPPAPLDGPQACSGNCQAHRMCKEARVCCWAASPALLASGSGLRSWDPLFAGGSVLSGHPPGRSWLWARSSCC